MAALLLTSGILFFLGSFFPFFDVLDALPLFDAAFEDLLLFPAVLVGLFDDLLDEVGLLEGSFVTFHAGLLVFIC